MREFPSQRASILTPGLHQQACKQITKARQQAGGRRREDYTRTCIMNDGGDDGDVDGDECWSNVKCPQFDIFSPKEVCSRAGVSHERLCFHTQKFLHTSYFDARKCLNTKKMCTDTFPDRNVYAQKLVHTHTNVYAQNFLHTEPFTHISFYTHNFLRTFFLQFYTVHRGTFTHRSFYTEKSLHRGVFTQRICYTKKSLYTKKPLRTKTVTRKSFYTEVFTHIGPHKVYLHGETFTQRPTWPQISFVTIAKSILFYFLTCDHHVVRNSCI